MWLWSSRARISAETNGKSEALGMFFRDGEGLKLNFIGRASKAV
jgi:hypothetical protein